MSLPIPELFPAEVTADKWIPLTLTSLRKLVSDALGLANRINGGGAATVTAWYIAPDTQEPIQIDADAEIVRKPFHAGQYRVRIMGNPTHYFRCAPSADGAPSEVAGALVDARRIESLDAQLTAREATIEVLEQRVSDARREMHDTEDKHRAASRTIDDLKAEIKSLKDDVENAAPFTQDQMIAILDVIATKVGEDDEDGKLAKMRARLAKMLSSTFGLIGSLARDPIILTAILERHLAPWEAYQATINEAAAEAGSKDRLGTGAKIVEHLLSNGVKLSSALARMAPRPAAKVAPARAQKRKA